MTVLVVFVTLALIGMAAIAIVNTLTFPRLATTAPQPTRLPRVSVLIPARNEAEGIGPTVRKLLRQTYPNFELIVLDDNSDDDTLTTIQAISQSDPRLKIMSGEPLPEGWLGKNWACHQLSQAAQGEWLIFTDADVCWHPTALAAVVAELSRTQADLLTIWPTQHSQSWGERLVVPMIAVAIISYLPLPLVHHTTWAPLAAANGQCLAFRRRAYDRVNGHVAVWNEVLEDVVMARHIKACGLKLRMADGAGLISCRMYQDWPAARAGFAKNILAGYGGQVALLGLGTIFHWLVFLGPWLWFMLGLIGPRYPSWPVAPLTLMGLGVATRALTAAVTRQRLSDALLMPISVLLMTNIALQAVWWHWRYGGPRWKGRLIGRSPAPGFNTRG